jgi:phosphate transport system protein
VIATRHPVATDLRLIVAVLRLTVEMERMGDHAAGVAKATLEICKEPLLKPLLDLPRMAEMAIEMVHEGVRAFVEGDAEAVQGIIDRDDDVDALYNQRELITYMLEDPSTVCCAIHLLWVAHGIGCFADRATNIAERILFVTSGRLEDLTSGARGYRLPSDDGTSPDETGLVTVPVASYPSPGFLQPS